MRDLVAEHISLDDMMPKSMFDFDLELIQHDLRYDQVGDDFWFKHELRELKDFILNMV